MKIGILATMDCPTLDHLLGELQRHGVSAELMIMDARTMSEKDVLIFQERTGGAFAEYSPEKFGNEPIAHYFFENHNNEDCVNFIESERVDLLINAGTPRILKSPILNAARKGILNCHPGLLPNYRGCTCVEWAIFNDDQVGNTVHFMVEGIDEGPMVVSEGIWFDRSDDYQGVRVKTYKHANELMARGVLRVASEGLSAEELPGQGQGKYYSVIDDVKLDMVKEKLAKGNYLYQK